MGKPTFEEDWKKVFQDAGMEVSKSVWSSIEVDLIHAENTSGRKQIVFYQRLAAGIALLVVALGSYLTYDFFADGATEPLTIAQQSVGPAQDSNPGSSGNTQAESNQPLHDQQLGEIASGNETGGKLSDGATKVPSPANQLAMTHLPQVLPDERENMLEVSPKKSFSRSYPPPQVPEAEVRLSRNTFYETNFPRKLPAMPAAYMASSTGARKASNAIWASLGASGGTYQPGTVSSSPGSTFSKAEVADLGSSLRPQPQSAQAASGSSYSLGVMLGKQIASRWLIQGGINYHNLVIDYTSNYVSQGGGATLKESVADYELSSSAVQFTTPYTISSSNKFVSVPVTAGYMVIDRNFGLAVNSGVSTDIHVQNTLSDESGQSGPVTQDAGKESPFRTINWSGLVNVEVSHKIGTNYSVAVVPGVRYAFLSALKEKAELAYNPLVLDVGFRFRYTFH